MGYLIPSAEEWRHLGRFYWATFLSEVLHLAMPFQVLLVVRYLGEPQLGILLAIEQFIALTMEVPTGAWADRIGRKRCVLAGHVLSAVGWLSIPLATMLDRDTRLIGMGAAFGFLGAGTALVSGAFEAWVVDNLRAQGRRDLTISYFGRERSLASAGGIGADVVALIALATMIDVRVFWIVSGIGELTALAILWATPEHAPTGEGLDHDVSEDVAGPRVDDSLNADGEEEGDVAILDAVTRGFAAIAGRPALLALTLVCVWIAATFGTSTEAFQAAQATVFESAFGDEHSVDRGFAGLELARDGIGAVAPLLAIWLAHRLGSRRLLMLGVLVPSAIALAVWRQPGVHGIVLAYFCVVACTDIFHTVADDYQHQLMPSAVRATASSAINLLVSIAGLVSAGWLAFSLAQWGAARTVAIMGLITLPAALFLIPKFSRAPTCPQAERAPG
jgi:MFS family permease